MYSAARQTNNVALKKGRRGTRLRGACSLVPAHVRAGVADWPSVSCIITRTSYPAPSGLSPIRALP